MNRLRLCMGSSCFARGNGRVVEVIKNFLKTHGLEASVDLSGALCEGRCGEGPMLFINEVAHTKVSPVVVEDILRNALLPQRTGTERQGREKVGMAGEAQSHSGGDESPNDNK